MGKSPEHGGAVIDPAEAMERLRVRQKQEPYAKYFGFEILELSPGRALVAMDPRPDMENVFGMLHGGAVFSLLDESFQLACNAHGTVAVALSVSINYLAPARAGVRLLGECMEINATRKTALYNAEVRQADGKLVASGQALAYRKGTPHPIGPGGELLK